MTLPIRHQTPPKRQRCHTHYETWCCDCTRFWSCSPQSPICQCQKFHRSCIHCIPSTKHNCRNFTTTKTSSSTPTSSSSKLTPQPHHNGKTHRQITIKSKKPPNHTPSPISTSNTTSLHHHPLLLLELLTRQILCLLLHPNLYIQLQLPLKKLQLT